MEHKRLIEYVSEDTYRVATPSLKRYTSIEVARSKLLKRGTPPEGIILDPGHPLSKMRTIVECIGLVRSYKLIYYPLLAVIEERGRSKNVLLFDGVSGKRASELEESLLKQSPLKVLNRLITELKQ